MKLIEPRPVPLGGLRAMTVRRLLPSRDRRMVGAWCFIDHYGPDDVAITGGMRVAPHPHTGLQTASWIFTGTIEHRDSLGTVTDVRPGELNLMTAGSGAGPRLPGGVGRDRRRADPHRLIARHHLLTPARR